MRLIVIVPAFNEAVSIADVLSRIPKALPGFAEVKVVVVDDGSTDGTGDRAREQGAHVVRHPGQQGLAAAFRTGLAQALRQNTDFIATLDADGQYKPEELALLTARAAETGADLVIGDRQVLKRRHMPLGNRIGNIIGSFMLRVLGTGVTDASSGFRFFSSRLGRALDIQSRHTYTHEMLIQTRRLGFSIAEVGVSFLPRQAGKSKLVRTLRRHIVRSCGTILRSLLSSRRNP